MKRAHGHRRLFWRVYRYGLLTLFAVGLAVGITHHLVDSQPAWRDMQERVAGYLGEELGALVNRPEDLQQRLDELHLAFNVDVAVYASDGRLIARAGGYTPPASSSRPTEVEAAWRRGRLFVTFPLAGDSYAALRSPKRGQPTQAILSILAVLAVLALVSLPLTRAVVRPLERLTAAARAFGSGDLTVRSGLRRRDELGVLADAFDEMAERIEGLVRSEKELLANVSHELRTPMARIRVALELAEEASDPAAAQNQLRGIATDLAELERLIDDVLTTARLGGAGNFPLRREPVALTDLLDEATRRFSERHPEGRVVTTEPPEPVPFEADPALLRRVVDNLLDNAERYAGSTEAAIELEAVVSGDRLLITVRDRGPGVADEDLPRLFEPFFRAERSRDRNGGGVGLGLALCRRIVEAHDGRVEARLREGGGLEIRIELPRAETPR